MSRAHRLVALSWVGLALVACSWQPHEERSGRATSALGAAFRYAFDAAGLPTLTDEGGVTREAGAWLVGGSRYALDALGRVIVKGDRAIGYGADGHIATVASPRGEATYLYDETGQRLLKSRAGIPVEAYVEEGVLTEAELVEPIAVAGSVVGVVHGGRFDLVATDMRGTPVADRDGTPRSASPFGARDVEPDVAAAIAYARRGYDADLDTIRMGVRDFDARSASFLQPDPLVLAMPSKCVEGVYDCNLYGYARGNPASYVDPAGTFPFYLHHAINETWTKAAGLSEESLRTINKASDAMDSAPHTQDAVNSYTHNMSDASHGQTPAEGRGRAAEFEHDMAKLAGLSAARGDMKGRDIALGMAFHTIQDGHSKAHGGAEGGGAPWGTEWMGMSTAKQWLGFVFSHIPGDTRAVNIPGMAQQMYGVYEESRRWEAFLRDPANMQQYAVSIEVNAHRHDATLHVIIHAEDK